MEKLNILVIFGGCSTEHSISCASAAAVLSHMDTNRFNPITVGITKDGVWLRYTGPYELIDEGSWFSSRFCSPCTLSPNRNNLSICTGSGQRERFDAAFPILHGKNGEDGTIQGLFELIGAPLIGCGTLSSAIGMDKNLAHEIVSCHGVSVPKGIVLKCGLPPSQVLEAAAAVGYPLFVKPICSGSSFGVSRVDTPEQLIGAAELAFRHDSRVLIEEAVPGFEVGCAVLGNDHLTVGAVDQIELAGGLFDFKEKYTPVTSAIHCPALIPDSKANEIVETAKVIYRALGCRVFARIDMFLRPDGEIIFNEVNTIPGFTAHSRYPSMMAAAGIDFTSLVTKIIELGVG